MSDFKAITTQEEFDAAIGERLKREKETLSKKYEGYLSPDDISSKEEAHKSALEDLKKELEEAKSRATEHDKTVAELNEKIRGYESDSVKTRIAHEVGLPYELAARLSGDDEGAIRKDAESLSKLIGDRSNTVIPPLASRESAFGAGGSSTDAAYASMLESLEGGE